MTVREFEYHFRKLYLQLGMYALRIIDDEDNAEDIVEEAFLKAWQTISSGTIVENFNSYIYRSVRNECVNFLRRKNNFEDIDAIPEISEEAIDTSIREPGIGKHINKNSQEPDDKGIKPSARGIVARTQTILFAISLKIFVHRIGLLSKRCVI